MLINLLSHFGFTIHEPEVDPVLVGAVDISKSQRLGCPYTVSKEYKRIIARAGMCSRLVSLTILVAKVVGYKKYFSEGIPYLVKRTRETVAGGLLVMKFGRFGLNEECPADHNGPGLLNWGLWLDRKVSPFFLIANGTSIVALSFHELVSLTGLRLPTHVLMSWSRINRITKLASDCDRAVFVSLAVISSIRIVHKGRQVKNLPEEATLGLKKRKRHAMVKSVDVFRYLLRIGSATTDISGPTTDRIKLVAKLLGLAKRSFPEW